MQAELEPEEQTAEFVPIECDYLDGENIGWAKRYVEDCRNRLAAADADDPRYARFLRTEIAAWEDLLARFAKPKS